MSTNAQVALMAAATAWAAEKRPAAGVVFYADIFLAWLERNEASK